MSMSMMQRISLLEIDRRDVAKFICLTKFSLIPMFRLSENTKIISCLYYIASYTIYNYNIPKIPIAVFLTSLNNKITGLVCVQYIIFPNFTRTTL